MHFLHHRPFVRGIHQSRVESSIKGPIMQKFDMFLTSIQHKDIMWWLMIFIPGNWEFFLSTHKTLYRSAFNSEIWGAFPKYFGEYWSCYNMLWLDHTVPCILLMCVPIGWQQVISWWLAWFIGSVSLPWVCYITLESFTISVHSPWYHTCCIRADSRFGPSQWETALTMSLIGWAQALYQPCHIKWKFPIWYVSF